MKLKKLFGLALVFFSLVLTGTNGYAETKTQSVFNGKARMELPVEYIRMPNDKLKKAYPQANGPKEAWYISNRNAKVLMTFSLFEMQGKKIVESNLGAIAEGMAEELRSPTRTEGKINGRKAIWLEAKSSNGKATMLQLSVYQGKLLVTTLVVEKDSRDKYFNQGKRAVKTLSY